MKHLSVFESDQEILKAISDIHLKGGWYDLDCTYSKGVFYKNILEPKIKSDLFPVDETILKMDSQDLNLINDNEIKSLVFDPPFLFRNRKSDNNDKISARFNYFRNFEELLNMYEGSLKEFKRVLSKNGILAFKCQDMTDGRFYCTHYNVIKIATSLGFELKDIAIKKSKSKLQKEAKQQNCFAKTHSYWLIFKKKVD